MGVFTRMSNEIRIPINVTGEDQAARDLKKVERAADDLGDSLGDLGDASTEVGKKTEDTGEKFKDTGGHADFLKKRVTELNGELKHLVEQLNSTGDTSLEKTIRTTERDARKYAKLLAKIPEEAATTAVKAGEKGGESFIDGLADAFRTGSAATQGAIVPLLVGLAVAATPMVGATLAAAVVGGVGAGGIVGGVAAAINDPYIAEAAEKLGGTLGSAFTELGRSTFGGPLLESFKILETAGKNFASGIKPALQGLAPLLVPLANGLEGLADQAMPGLKKAFEAAKPVIRVVADELPHIGAALGDFFDSVSEDPDGAIMAMKFLLGSVEGVIRWSGKAIAVLSDIFEWSVHAAGAVSGFLADAFGWVPVVGGVLEQNATAFQGLANSANGAKSAAGDFAGNLDVIGTTAGDAAAQVEKLKTEIDDLFGIQMGLERAQVAAAQGMKDLVKELRDGPKVIDLVSEAGLRNRQALDSQISAWNDVRKAQIDAGMPIEEANKRFRNQIDVITNLAHGMGFAGKEFDAFMAKWRSVPDEAEKTFRFKIEAAAGSATAWSMVRAAERQLEGRATGGPVKAGQTYRVGENGPEIVTFGQDGYVHNAAATRAMTSGASGGSAMGAWGGSAVQVEATARWVTGGDEFMEALAKAIRIDVKWRGGGSVQDAYGENEE
jgi:hypothetical protein